MVRLQIVWLCWLCIALPQGRCCLVTPVCLQAGRSSILFSGAECKVAMREGKNNSCQPVSVTRWFILTQAIGVCRAITWVFDSFLSLFDLYSCLNYCLISVCLSKDQPTSHPVTFEVDDASFCSSVLHSYH